MAAGMLPENELKQPAEVISGQRIATVSKFTGGARIGWVNATWPFARLSVSAQQLSIASLIGSYTFRPEQVAALEPYGSIPVFSSGIRIVHTDRDYPETIVFWCVGGRDRVFRQISALGFAPRATTAQVPARKGMAWRWSFIAAAVFLWNLLLYLDGVRWREQHDFGPWSLAALAAMFAASIALATSRQFQSLALRPGRSPAEIQPMARLIRIVSGLLLIVATVQYVVR